MISLDNLEKAKPLAEQLKALRQALNEMNQAPAVLRYFVHRDFVGHRGSFEDLQIPNSVARDLLARERDRLVVELQKLGVDA